MLVCAGRAGEECKCADGRELWVLSEMYQVAGVHEWLLAYGINEESCFAAHEFGLVHDEHWQQLTGACESFASVRLADVVDSSLDGVGAQAARVLVEVLGSKLGRRRGARSRVLELCIFVKQWWRVNERWVRLCQVHEIMALLDLTKLSSKQVDDIVEPSGLVSPDDVPKIISSINKDP